MFDIMCNIDDWPNVLVSSLSPNDVEGLLCISIDKENILKIV